MSRSDTDNLVEPQVRRRRSNANSNLITLDVTGESQRYAAFRAEKGDTAENLPPRIIAYYAQLLADRARPREFRPAWSKPAPKTKPAE